MTSIAQTEPRRIVVGVDTHKYAHVAVALDPVGTRLGESTISVDRAGYEQLEHWAHQHGEKICFGIEGTGSYGAGLTSFLRRRGHRVIEVNRPDRRIRHLHGKNDLLDAESGARAVLAGTATAVPKSADGTAEMIRQVKIAKDTAVTARSQAMITLKTVVVTAPTDLRDQREPLTDTQLIGLHDRILQTLTQCAAPELTSRFSIGPDSTAELLLIVGDNPERIRSKSALAKLCGVCPVSASSGKTTRHRLNRGGHRQANAALHRIIISRMRFHQPTRDYLARRTTEGKTKRQIMRCLKRLLIREVYQILVAPRKTKEKQLVA